MKTIYLLRHAEADNAPAPGGDHDRPLSEKGRRDALNLGALLKAERIIPALTHCSDARRTSETLTLLQCDAPPALAHHLYLAEAETLLSEIQNASEEADSLLILAHNPGIAEIAAHFSGDRFLELEGFPPATFGIFKSVATNWADVSTKNTNLDRVFLTP